MKDELVCCITTLEQEIIYDVPYEGEISEIPVEMFQTYFRNKETAQRSLALALSEFINQDYMVLFKDKNCIHVNYDGREFHLFLEEMMVPKDSVQICDSICYDPSL
ncbi:hypothetical protein GOV11_01920 [Candidatus Woesearchaeota archaeon]|nr:hypothetical protein [Candidatus Woesearchaeota archaeon]